MTFFGFESDKTQSTRFYNRAGLGKVLLLSVAVVSLSACQTLEGLRPEATIVDAKAEVPLPSTWVEPAPSALPNSDWVAGFQSAELTKLVDTALESNPTIGGNIAQLDQALARIRTSRADLLPNLSAGASTTISRGARRCSA